MMNVKFSYEKPTVQNLTLEQWEKISEERKAKQGLREKERLKRYEIGTRTIPIPQELADKIYRKIETAIRQMKEPRQGQENGVVEIVKDGYTVTFRCLANEQLWTLTCHVPEGDLEHLSVLCLQLIDDVQTGRFDPEKSAVSFAY